MIDLSRYTEQHELTYSYALQEIRSGRKETHWMWWIFPQIHGLGQSSTSQYYAIQSLQEAAAFLQDPYLGGHLVEISSALLALCTDNPSDVFEWPDDRKLLSCMTLFSLVCGEIPVFHQVIEKYYNGKPDYRTLEILGLA